MAEVIPADSVSPPFREKRLGHDLRGLIGDSPEGTFLQRLVHIWRDSYHDQHYDTLRDG